MKWLTSPLLWGILLIAGGVLFLLDNLGVITLGGLIWGIALAAGGIIFLSVFFTERQHWWALIPGIILLAVSALVILEELFPGRIGEWGGVIVLGGISLAFLMVYLANRENWWAIIPMGVLATLAAVVGLSETYANYTGFDLGGVFFIGLGLTFGLVAILPSPQGQMRWAFIPAGILLVIGFLILAALSSFIGYIWPLALIIIGLFILIRALGSRR